MTTGMSAFLSAWLHEDGPAGQPLGAGDEDVGLQVDVDEAVAQQPRDDRREAPAERDGGKDERLWRAGAQRGQPAKVDGEDEDQDERQPEERDGGAEHDEGGPDAVQPGAGPHAGDDADRDADDDAHAHRREGEDEGRAGVRPDFRGDVLAGHVGLAEVAVEDAAEKVDELRRQRLVEAELLAQLLDLVRGRARAEQQDLRRVSRDQVQDQEDQDGDAEQDRDGQQQPARDEVQHRAPRRGRGQYAIVRMVGLVKPKSTLDHSPHQLADSL